ncbi:MAG: lipase family protein [Gammaproteobacteria bacterium]|nr:lipase family protein [Gammaproteobacteria bacterium]
MRVKLLLRYTHVAIIVFISCVAARAMAAAQPDQSPINFAEIKEFATLANAAYQPLPKIRTLSALKKYRLSHYSNIPEIEISYFLVTDDVAKTQVVVVRGTSNVENAMVNAALKLTLDRHLGVRLHNGFSQSAQAIYTEIKPLLKTDYVISLTGHSLGGAVALILAMHLDVDDFTVGKVVTFGQPKVTNVAGTNAFKHLDVIRVVTPKDLVPLVPPFDPVDIYDLDVYWHSGRELILLADSTYALLEGVNSLLRATRFTQEPLNDKNLQDHQMTLYMLLLDKKISAASLVPFTNSFNLFNLFGAEKK